MNKKSMKEFLKQCVAITLAFALCLSSNVYEVKAEELTAETTYPAVTKAEYYDGESAYTFYQGFNDHYYIASGSQIIFTYDDGSTRKLRIASGAYIDPEGDGSKFMKMRTGHGKADIELSLDAQNNVRVNYSDAKSGQEFVRSIYTRKISTINTMEPLSLGVADLNSNSRTTKYYRITADEILMGSDTAYLKTYTTGDTDTYLRLYDANGQMIDRDDDSGESTNADLLYKINKGNTYVLAVSSFDYNYKLVTKVVSEQQVEVSSVTDRGSKYYTGYDISELHFTVRYADNTTKDYDYIGYIFDEDYIFGDLRINDYYLNDNETIYTISLKSRLASDEREWTLNIPAVNNTATQKYEIGNDVTIPANTCIEYLFTPTQKFTLISNDETDEVYANLKSNDWDEYIRVNDTCYVSDENVGKEDRILFMNESSSPVTVKLLDVSASVWTYDYWDYSEEGDRAWVCYYNNETDEEKTVPCVLETVKVLKDCTQGGYYNLKCTVSASDALDGVARSFVLKEFKTIPAVQVHTPITDVAVAATKDHTGLTEGSHCSECGMVLKAQKVIPKLSDNSGNNATPESASVKIGSQVKVSGGKYKVASAKNVTYVGPVSQKATNVNIPSSIKIKGKKYQVTQIAPKACKGIKKLKKVTIPASIVKIGNKAFQGDKNLKKIIIKTKKLKKATFGKAAFLGINKKAVFKLPKAKKKAYKKILLKKGATKKMKFK